jgi:GT2 family glycosyltransferase
LKDGIVRLKESYNKWLPVVIELSIIIVNWNGGHLLRCCIESLIKYPPGVPYEILVVDNASTDGSIDWLRSKELEERLGNTPLRLIENSDNRGFSKANNQGIALSDAPTLFLLNADAEVTAGAIDRLVSTLKSDEQVGACGPRLLNTDGSLQVSVWRNPPTPWEILLAGSKLHRLLPKHIRGELLLQSHWDHNRRRRVNMLSGAALLVKRRVIEDVGGLDERFHMYGEDNEWCLRVVRAGWVLMFEPDASVVHHGGQSSAKRWDSLEKLRVQLEANFRFQKYCLPRRHAAANILANSFLLFLQRALRKVQGRPAEEVEISLKMHLEGLKRALRDR